MSLVISNLEHPVSFHFVLMLVSLKGLESNHSKEKENLNIDKRQI